MKGWAGRLVLAQDRIELNWIGLRWIGWMMGSIYMLGGGVQRCPVCDAPVRHRWVGAVATVRVLRRLQQA